MGLELGISLVCHANHWFATGEINQAKIFCQEDDVVIRFFSGEPPELLTDNVEDWLKTLRADGATHLRLVVDPRPRDLETVVLHGVGGAPLWAPYSVGSLVESIWHVGKSVQTDRPEYAFFGSRATKDQRPERGNLVAARLELSEALVEAIDLSSERNEEEWASLFTEARDLLNAADIFEDPHSSLILPEGFGSMPQRQLLASAMTVALSFEEGGWCEWEGVPGPGRNELARVALNLYVSSLGAIGNAVNAA